MARYCTAAKMRSLLGLPDSTVNPNYDSDETLEYFIDLSDQEFLSEISVRSYDETCSGGIDGKNNTFNVSSYPIADINFDGSISPSDIEVFTWSDSDDLDTKSSVSVSSVDWREGRIKLTSAPASTIERISCNYRYYLYEPNMNLFEEAVGYLAGEKYFASKYLEAPSRFRIGAGYYVLEDPARRSLALYHEVLNKIREKQFFRGEVSDNV